MEAKTNRIMLVEDEIIVAMDVQHRLEAYGYQVVAHATTGEEAVVAAAREKPDLILMDIKLHGQMDGIEAATKIHETFKVPIIYLTAFSNDMTLQRARLTEAYGYLIKPFEDRELYSAIEIALYKHQMEEKLRESEERYALILRATNDGIWDWNLQTDQVYYSARWKKILGFDEDQDLTSPQMALNLVHPDDVEAVKQAFSSHLDGLSPTLEYEVRMLHRDGSYRWMLCRGIALFDADHKPYRITGAQSDVTRRREMEEQLLHKAFHDELTALPNRALFMDRLAMAMERARRSREKVNALLYLDIDQFKVINDSLGHLFGDELLIAIARRLAHNLRPGDTVARLGGDEFAILVEDITDITEGISIAERICEEFRHPFQLHGHEIYSSASIGIVVISQDYKHSEDLMRDADIAMYHAKYNGRFRYELFNPDMRSKNENRLQIIGELHAALKNREFILYYQPIYKLPEQKIVGAEALIRWQHPMRGLLLPGEFIRIAEESGLIIAIGDWVLDAACQQAKIWQDAGQERIRVSVNLSALQFNDKDLIDKIQAALSTHNLQPDHLELELTETVAMQNIKAAIDVMQKLRNMGVNIAIDDFGSGYSSLDYIKQIPTNNLKIDRSFLTDLNKNDTTIISTMINMAHQLKVKVIAEGVETEKQLYMLSGMECDQVQGFLLGKPMPPELIWRE